MHKHPSASRKRGADEADTTWEMGKQVGALIVRERNLIVVEFLTCMDMIKNGINSWRDEKSTCGNCGPKLDATMST